MIKPLVRYYDDFTARSRLFGKQRDYSHGYRVIRIRGGKDENLNVRDRNRGSKKTRITLTNSAAIRAPSPYPSPLSTLFYTLFPFSFSFFSFAGRFFPSRRIELVRNRRRNATCQRDDVNFSSDSVSSFSQDLSSIVLSVLFLSVPSNPFTRKGSCKLSRKRVSNIPRTLDGGDINFPLLIIIYG